MGHKIAILILTLFAGSVFASMAPESTPEKQPLVDINVGIELGKLEQSALNIEESIQLASQALQEMAKDPNISAEQQEKIIATFERIDQLSESLQTTIKQIPEVINQSAPPITIAIDNLFSNIQLTVIMVLLSLLLIIIVALVAVYYWLLKPTSLMLLKTTAKVDNMATALQTTANIVEKSTEQQLLILNALPKKE
ncbi:hypothetical protein GCM10007916_07540 [Psychromonas marina]|uniref:GTP-binding protein n=1 Tax=Psychromonas marina TaxID=88364 RepID=A0ABQ6DX16_9GAMM|nr:hypothetical protein [Psychromonas marina]GLS89687.1 hypothetical protein GCM10007916_07540 [Psychromonas marina]